MQETDITVPAGAPESAADSSPSLEPRPVTAGEPEPVQTGGQPAGASLDETVTNEAKPAEPPSGESSAGEATEGAEAASDRPAACDTAEQSEQVTAETETAEPAEDATDQSAPHEAPEAAEPAEAEAVGGAAPLDQTAAGEAAEAVEPSRAELAGAEAEIAEAAVAASGQAAAGEAAEAVEPSQAELAGADAKIAAAAATASDEAAAGETAEAVEPTQGEQSGAEAESAEPPEGASDSSAAHEVPKAAEAAQAEPVSAEAGTAEPAEPASAEPAPDDAETTAETEPAQVEPEEAGEFADLLPGLEAEAEYATLKAVIEGIVYVTEEPVTVAQMAAALDQSEAKIQEILGEIIDEFDQERHGLAVREIAGGYKMTTKPEHHEAIRNFVRSLKAPLKLSLAALETLATIAYKQPITAPEIMEIRGVQGTGVLKTLLDRKLIVTAGRKNVVGRPMLYKTTKEFLVQFGLRDLSELPSLKEFEELKRLAFSDGDVAAPEPESEPEEKAGPEENA